jgi:Amt family ammonium transporter
LLRSIGDAVISTDRHGTVQFLNAAAERLTGWSGAEACGQPLEQVLRLVQSGEAEPLPIRAAVAQVLSEGKVMRFTAHGAELIRRDGSTAPIGERAAPLKNHEGEVVGMVVVMRDVTPERRLSNQLRHQANHDALTGLPNRALFEQRLAFMLQDCRGSGRKYAVMFLDLDQFKIVNDTCGHAAGDELIRRVATCTQSQLRAGDLVARLGGDEFGLLLPDCPVEEALQLAERVRHAIGGLRFNWEGRTFIVHASIGVVQDEPNLSSITDVLCAADRACYVAKEAGRNRVRLYRADDREIDGRHGEMQWVARLNAALEQDRFVLYAQEIKAIGATRWLAGRRCFEVLLRLREESGRLILPRAFLPAAERFGLMPRIDCHVITRVFAEQGRRHRLGLPIHRCMINLSNSSIDNQDLADFIADLLREHALPSGAIGFELTETAAITHLATATSVIERLRSLGCPIALDDFGSGMASYGYLRELPVDMMKIDGAFVRDMTRDPVAFAMVESMHRVAQAIGIQTVAEGIEDESTLSALTLMKIDFAQGHAISIEDLLSDVLDRCGAQTDALDSSRAQATG